MRASELIEHLDGVRPNGSGWRALCPAHDDREPSLSIREGDDGQILVRCFAGCETDAIVKALGLTLKDLFADDSANRSQPAPIVRTLRHELRRKRDGELVAIHVRKERADGTKDMPFEQPNGQPGLGGRRKADLPLYGIHKLNGSRGVIVCEGEKKTDALIDLGLPAVGTSTGSTTCPNDEPLRDILDKEMICLWPDNDTPGRSHMDQIAARLTALGAADVRIIEWPDAPPKGDAADFVRGGRTANDVRALVRNAVRWQPTEHHHNHIPRVNDDDDESPALPRDLSLVAEPGPTRFAVAEMLPEGYATNLYADSGQGKSYVALWLAGCLIRGVSFLGRAVISGPVLYLDWELDEAMQRRRWGEICRGAGLADVRPGLFYQRMTLPLLSALPQVTFWQEQINPVVTIIDSVGKAVGNDPVDHQAIIGFYSALDTLGTSLCIDHQPKPGGDSGYANKWEFGSSYKRHLARCSWQLERVGSEGGSIGLVLRHKKSNFGPLSADIHAELSFTQDAAGLPVVALQAADDVAGVSGERFGLRGAILDALACEQLTADGLADRLDSYDIGSIKNALTELKRGKHVEAVGRDGRAALYGRTASSSPSLTLGK